MQHDKHCSFVHLGVDTLKNKGRFSLVRKLISRPKDVDTLKKISVDAAI